MTTNDEQEEPIIKLAQGKQLSPSQEVVLIKRMVALTIAGMNYNQMSKQLKLGRNTVSRLCNTPEFEKLLEEKTEAEIGPLIVRARVELSKLVSKAIQVVHHHLDNNSLDAVKITFKAIGLENQEQVQRDAPINIIMPGQSPEPTTIILPTEGDEP